MLEGYNRVTFSELKPSLTHHFASYQVYSHETVL
jgi:hypothetical protein